MSISSAAIKICPFHLFIQITKIYNPDLCAFENAHPQSTSLKYSLIGSFSYRNFSISIKRSWRIVLNKPLFGDAFSQFYTVSKKVRQCSVTFMFAKTESSCCFVRHKFSIKVSEKMRAISWSCRKELIAASHEGASFGRSCSYEFPLIGRGGVISV